MSKQDKQFERWWRELFIVRSVNSRHEKELARAAYKAGQNQDNDQVRLKDLKQGDLFRLARGRQVYIVCKEYDSHNKVFYNAKGNVYDAPRNAEVVRIHDRREFWEAKDQ